jgi:hypothetical protein
MFIQTHFIDYTINILILNLLLIIIGLCLLNYFSIRFLIITILNFRNIDREEIDHISHYL